MITLGSLIQSKQVFTVQQNATVLEVAKYIAEKNVGAVAVLEGSRLVGIFSERDIITRVVAKQLDPRTVHVDQVMTKDLIVADANEGQESALRKMKSANCRHLPVVSGEKLLGLISLRDLLQVEITERDEKLEFLNSYLFHLPPDAGKRGGT